MDRRELYDNPAETLQIAIRGLLGDVWTALPGVVQKYDHAKNTVDVQPAVNGRARNLDGSYRSIQMPVLLDCPVLWQGGGGVTLFFKIAAGDECLVIFASRCIDAWWQNGFQSPTPGSNPPVNQANDPLRLRMHSLSDGFALVGLRSLPRVITPVSLNDTVLQSDDGSTSVVLDPVGQRVSITAPGGLYLNGVLIDASQNVTAAGTVTGTTDVVGGGKHLKTHVHTGGTISGDTGPPT